MLRSPKLISLVLPVFNEEEVLPLLLPRLFALAERLPCPAELIFVDDGSRDRTAAMLAQVIMDADLQDPPEMVLQMVERYCEGFDVVYAQRTARHGETTFKRWTAAAFYWLMRRLVHADLPENTGDFRLMSREVVTALGQLREQHRFVRGMVTWLGFRQTALKFERPPRAAGQTKYPLRKMLAFAWRAISSFSGVPLRMAMFVGIALVIASLAYAAWAGYQALIGGGTAPGWASLVCLQVGLSGVTLLCLGLVGDYIARIYEEIKGRPLYIVGSLANLAFDPAKLPPRAAICPRVEAPRASLVPAPNFKTSGRTTAASDSRD
jgi:dolichol-phosphate mannosyltransferase